MGADPGITAASRLADVEEAPIVSQDDDAGSPQADAAPQVIVPQRYRSRLQRLGHAAANAAVLAGFVVVAIWAGVLIWLAVDVVEGWFS